ncbi:MAG: ATP synthase F0 subunit B [Desulfobacterales bacterium]|nr:ATP synthase F0 subunit B [Desulfobacterales bacterium]
MKPSNSNGVKKYRRQNVIALWRVFSRALIVFFIVMLLSSFDSIASDSSEEGHESSPSKGWVRTDSYRVMNFAVLAIALFLLLRKPVSQALNSRIKGIEDNLDELEALKKEAEKRLAHCNEKLYSLDKEAEKIISEYLKQGNEAKGKILKEAEAASEKLKAQAQKNIEHVFEKARLKLETEIFEKAIGKAEELIKNKITVEDQNQLVNEYLDKVVEL